MIINPCNKKDYKNYNTGLSLLKGLCAWAIVVCHFYDGSSPSFVSTPLTLFGGIAVPIFVFVTFTLFDIEKNSDLRGLIKRSFRPFYPILFFTIVYGIVYLLFPDLSNVGEYR